jgi:hypothetical protein
MTQFLFSYGTLQKEEVQLKLFSRILHGHKVRLAGYRLIEIEITDEAFLAKGEQKNQLTLVPSGIELDFVEGMAFEVTEEELLHADKYEPSNYKRIAIAAGSAGSVWAYIADE